MTTISSGRSSADSSVLVVEDDPAIVELVQAQLEKAGLHVESAADGEEGLIKAQDTLPDVIIMDLSMPRVDGFEMLRQLRSQRAFRDIPVLVLSARSGRPEVMKALSLGAKDYVVKPFDGANLTRRVMQLIKPPPQGAWLL
jgi:two-component system alkaline phosphatase synthesis response regulator PhoP